MPDIVGLSSAVERLGQAAMPPAQPTALPTALPETGIGETAALEALAPHVFGRAAQFGAPEAFASMDPPTPWLTWALTLWNARLNQNLLHPSGAPFGRDAEATVIDWLAPRFGMNGGHITPGSSPANLTALWAARDVAGARRVLTSPAAHLSIRKATHILGMAYEEIATDALHRMDASRLPSDLSDACLVLTAGTTAAGAIDPLSLCGRAAWTHVDAAWAGPLRLSETHAARLTGIEHADSVAISAHKWLFQPKESALVLFRDTAAAHGALAFTADYLVAPNIGLLGSHGATAIPLMGLLMAWGRRGLANRIDHCMAMADALAAAIAATPELRLFGPPESGVVMFRPRWGDTDRIRGAIPAGGVSTVALDGQTWLRCVAANPNADIDTLIARLIAAAAT